MPRALITVSRIVRGIAASGNPYLILVDTQDQTWFVWRPQIQEKIMQTLEIIEGENGNLYLPEDLEQTLQVEYREKNGYRHITTVMNVIKEPTQIQQKPTSEEAAQVPPDRGKPRFELVLQSPELETLVYRLLLEITRLQEKIDRLTSLLEKQ